MTANKYMVGNDDLLSIIERAKPNYGMPKQRRHRSYSPAVLNNTSRPVSDRNDVVRAAVSFGVFLFIGAGFWGVAMLAVGHMHKADNFLPSGKEQVNQRSSRMQSTSLCSANGYCALHKARD